jgi:hypothetical protein
VHVRDRFVLRKQLRRAHSCALDAGAVESVVDAEDEGIAADKENFTVSLPGLPCDHLSGCAVDCEECTRIVSSEVVEPLVRIRFRFR